MRTVSVNVTEPPTGVVGLLTAIPRARSAERGARTQTVDWLLAGFGSGGVLAAIVATLHDGFVVPTVATM